MQHIKHIIFDLGGVILNIDYKKTERAFIDLGLADFPQLYSQLQQTHLFDHYETGAISSATFISQLKSYLPSASDEAIITAWNAMLLDLPIERLRLLQQLQLYYDIYLLSNTNELHELAFNQQVKQLVGYDNFAPFFNKIYLSHQIKHRKPNSEAFEIILNENKLTPAQTLFIDDSPQHIEGAKALGIQTIHLQAPKTILDIFKPKS